MTPIRCTCGKPGHESRLRPKPIRYESNPEGFTKGTLAYYQNLVAFNTAQANLRLPEFGGSDGE